MLTSIHWVWKLSVPAAAAADDDDASVVVVAFCKCTRKTNRVEKQTIKQRRINKHTLAHTKKKETKRNKTKPKWNTIIRRQKTHTKKKHKAYK